MYFNQCIWLKILGNDNFISVSLHFSVWYIKMTYHLSHCFTLIKSPDNCNFNLWLTQFDRGIDLGCSLLGRAKNRTWSYLRIYIYYCMLQMKKNTSKKCSLKCILSVATAMHALFLRHTFILYLLKSTPGGQVAWLPICKNRTLIIYVGHLIRNWPSRRSYM